MSHKAGLAKFNPQVCNKFVLKTARSHTHIRIYVYIERVEEGMTITKMPLFTENKSRYKNG